MFPDGWTPESHGFAIVFDSGLPSPNISSLFLVDANGDPVADSADLGILLDNYYQFGTFSTNNFDNSGIVDSTDLGILLNDYNQPPQFLATTAPVPDPSTFALVAFCALGLLIAARRRR